jgi:hypothetical protein
VSPGQGVTVFQVDFLETLGAARNTTWGRLLVDPARLAQATGVDKGWLNVATATGWAVCNLPVPPAADGPFAVYFDLGLSQAGALTTTTLTVLHTPLGLGGIEGQTGTPTEWPVEDWEIHAAGWGPQAEIVPELPPPALSIGDRIPPPEWAFGTTQLTTNEQCAHLQCLTMSIANALQYLEDMGVITIPHDHAMGLNSDATLVGQLDWYCSRGVFSREEGTGLGFRAGVDGTFHYLSDNGLTGILTHRHQDQTASLPAPGLVYTVHGSSSVWYGDMPDWSTIWSWLNTGCAVIAGFTHASGGHAVRLTGAWEDSAGNQWLRYAHDALQTNFDPTDSLGLETVVVQLLDLDADGIPNLGSQTRELRTVWGSCP